MLCYAMHMLRMLRHATAARRAAVGFPRRARPAPPRGAAASGGHAPHASCRPTPRGVPADAEGGGESGGEGGAQGAAL